MATTEISHCTGHTERKYQTLKVNITGTHGGEGENDKDRCSGCKRSKFTSDIALETYGRIKCTVT